ASAQLLHPPCDQRLQRGDEQPHPRADQAGQWIPQPRTPQTRPVLSSRKSRHAPNRAVKITRKTRKDQKRKAPLCREAFVHRLVTMERSSTASRLTERERQKPSRGRTWSSRRPWGP